MTRILGTALALVVLAFVVTTIAGVRGQPGFNPAFDGWLQVPGYVLAAALAFTRPVRRSFQRDMWSLIAASLALRALGFLLFVPWIRTQTPQPYPSLADAAWLLSSVLLLVALLNRLRIRAARLTRPLALDALTAATTAAALAIALLYDVMVDLNAETAPKATATNIAYPVLDVAQIVVVLSLLAAMRWRPPPSRGVLAVGIGMGAIVDCVFLYQVSAGTYRPGTWLASLALVGSAAIAFAAVMPDGDHPTVLHAPPGLTAPAVFSLVGIGIFVYAAYQSVPVGALLFAAASVALSMTRALITLAQDRTLAREDLEAANEEMRRFQSLVETSSDFIAIADLEGQVMYVNPAGRRMVGLDPDDDVRATSIADYLTEEGVRASVEVERPAVIANGRWEGESTLRDLRGGPPTPVAISSFLMRDQSTRRPFALATVQRDISERVASERAVTRLADERRELLDRLVEAQEDERSRIAAGVHDDSVQMLAALELRLSLLRNKAGQSAPSMLEVTEASLATVREATVRLRDLLFDLESPAPGTDLAAAIDSAASHVFEHVDVRFEVTGDSVLDLSESAQITAYRIAKEALVNVRKHARARRALVNITRQPEGVLLTIDDDGIGVASEDIVRQPGHLGLSSMRDRASVAGGSLEVARLPDQGTRVTVWLPSDDPAP